MKVSIIIPVYNVAPYLERCLSSCINQTFWDIEIIVVNDASSDSSLQIIQEYASTDSRIVVINKKRNEGLIYARRSGIEIAQSEYIFHLDGDDFIPDIAIEYLYREVKHFNVDMVIGDHCQLKDNRLFCYEYYDIEPGKTRQNLLYELICVPSWSVCGKLIRKSLYKNLIYKSISMGEDLYQVIQFVPKVESASIIHSCVYYQVVRADSMAKNKNNQQLSTQYLQLIESIYSLMEDYLYEERVQIEISVLLLRLLCFYCRYKETGAARLILKQEFLQKREFRHLLWRKHKFFYMKCCLYLFSPRISEIIFSIVRDLRIKLNS